MKIFALTGGSGVGKTNVARLMRENGFYIIDADEVGHKVTDYGTQCFDELVATFGTEIINEDGSLNRKKLGKLVFGNESKLKSLNSITHHYILLEIKRMLKNIEEYEYVGIDGAVILGSEIEKLCQFVVVVDARSDIRLNRIKERDKISDADAKKRLSSQPDGAFYRERADYIIENNGAFEELESKVKKVCTDIRNEQ